MEERTTLEQLLAHIEKRQKVYVRYAEGAKLYSMSENSFMQLAKNSGAVKKINGVCIVNTELLNEYIEKNFG